MTALPALRPARIQRGSNGSHNVMLNDASIDVSATVNTCAFVVEVSNSINLTLTGTNTLKSGLHTAGLLVSTNAELVITAASTGSLTATGGEVRAAQTAIRNENSDREKRGGTVNVTGGKVVATGSFGIAILNSSGNVFVGGTAEVLT